MASDATRLARLKVVRADPARKVHEDPVLAGCPLVLALGEAAQAVISRARLVRFSAGQVVYRSGERPTDLYLVVSGRLSVVTTLEAVPVDEVEAGGVAGCDAALGRPAHSLTVVAREETEAVALDGETLGLSAAVLDGLRTLLQDTLADRERRAGELAAFVERW